MGPGLSSNYDQINPVFNVSFWKVHSAVHKATADKVSLWMIDSALLNEKIPNKTDQEKYLTGFLSGIQKLKKFRHPNLLKIIEVQEKITDLAFSSEPVSSSLVSLIGNFDNTDATYIGYQLAEAMNFLHKNAKTAHLGLSPEAVFLDESLNIKLFNFNWTSSIASNNSVQAPFSQYTSEASLPPVCYSSPEMVSNKSIDFHTDVFSFALIFVHCVTGKPLLNYNSHRDYDVGRNPISSVSGISPNIYSLLSECLQVNPQSRPDFAQIVSNDAFQSVNLKVLRYLDLIIAKDPKDKFGFFKGLSKAVGSFSPLLCKGKILPVLIEECKNDVRFAPVLLGSIFLASGSFSVNEFTNIVFKKISFLVSITDPPQVSIALIQHLPLILEKTDTKLHNDCVYPIIFHALQSTDSGLQKECLKKLPLVVEKIHESAIQTSLLPKLAEVAINSSEPSMVASSISCVAICLNKADNESFLRSILPKVYEAWKKHQSAPVAAAMLEVIETVKATNKTMMSRAIPVAADITSNPVAEPYVQKRLCNWMIRTINGYKESGKLDQVDDPQPVAKPITNSGNEFKMEMDDFKQFDISIPEKPSDTVSPNSNKVTIGSFDLTPAPKKDITTFDFDFDTPKKSNDTRLDFSIETPPPPKFPDPKSTEPMFPDPISITPKKNPEPIKPKNSQPPVDPFSSLDFGNPSPKPTGPSLGRSIRQVAPNTGLNPPAKNTSGFPKPQNSQPKKDDLLDLF